jgi:hypothetical protein
MTPDFAQIRMWDGSQDRAFEELCFQLRDPLPAGAELIKPGSPDAGYEWYVRYRNGVEHGWQVKYSFKIDDLLKLMEQSLRTVVEKRPACRRLTFCIPFDLPDARVGNERKSAQQKFEDRKKSWCKRIPGADRIRIELWNAGILLEKLTNHPNERGITWFFWQKEVFSRVWLEKRLRVTTDAAGSRYTPELHVELPVAFALEGLGSSELFWRRYRERRAAIAARLELRYAGPGLGVTDALRALRRAAAEWAAEVREAYPPDERLPRLRLLESTEKLLRAVRASTPPPPAEGRRETERQREQRNRVRNLRDELWRLSRALDEFGAFLDSPAGRAAERGAQLLTGEAGQGKTHLLCDAGERALAEGTPTVVLLGGRLSGSRFWSNCADYLGLGQVGGEVLLGAMRAAAEAAGAPFLLLVDALNEAASPRAWRDELPGLLAELDGDPWISLGVSVRSAFLPVVLPPEGLPDLVEVEHPGFRGRELEAMEQFFDAYGLEQPRVPLLTPEFTNPLFLKLYCEGLQRLGLSAPPEGEAHISDVFTRHLKWKARAINARLELDPARRSVERALDDVSAAMAAAGRDDLRRADTEALVNAHAPQLHRWPNTLFGQLLSEGLLAADVAWDREAGDYRDVIRFQYQRFADYRVASALLEPFADVAALRAALTPKQTLRATLLSAPAGWIEALAVLVPERFGIELLDAANWRLGHAQRRRWLRAHVRSALSRRPGAVTAATRKWLQKAERESRYLQDEVFEMLLAIAPIPDHPLNAEFLHNWLLPQPMPDRDAGFGIRIFHLFGDEGALDRLIRWASRGPYPDCPDEVLRLAGALLAWTLSSPNRFMRDYATKALRQLLATRLPVLSELIAAFAGVNDPYVSERLAVTAHGCLLTAGAEDPDGALRLARTLRDELLAQEEIPNVLTRDAVRGSFEWLLRAGLIEVAEYGAVMPPYGSAPPGKPRTKLQLERAYERRRKDRKGDYVPSPYGSLFVSLFGLGDFGRYVVESELHHFSNVPLHKPYPKPPKARPAGPLTSAQQAEAHALLERLNAEQLDQLLTQLETPRRAHRPRELRYPGDLAHRWIFERVVELGWTPERFDEFERIHLRGMAGRDSHKPERFGKKYQWIALRELLARVADNFHMAGEWDDTPRRYEGPWQFYGRDIDPTLPPAARERDEEDDATRLGATFQPEPRGSWWQPAGPEFLSSDPLPPDDWAAKQDHIPSLDHLVRHRDSHGGRWLVLQGYFNWDDERHDQDDRPRRDLWSHIYSWLVPVGRLALVVAHLKTRSFMGRWMPEGGTLTNDPYLGEMPWAAAAREYPPDWEPIRMPDPEAEAFEVYPAWVGYHWEGGGYDCSLEEGVSASLPAPLLFEQGGLRWRPGTRSWTDGRDAVVAEYRQGGGHSVLLVRESWLKPTLAAGGWGLVVGWLGEKQLISGGWDPGLIGGWTELNGVASFGPDRWKIASEASKLVAERTAGDA